MRMKIRWFGLGLILIIVASMSVSFVAARSFPINWRDLQPGGREQGAWLYCIAGDHCHNLLPIFPLYPKDPEPGDPNKIGTQAVSHSSPSRSSLRKIGDAAPPRGAMPAGTWKGFTQKGADGGVPIVNIQGGSLSSEVDHLESDLRDAIRKLND